ncbi:flavodoxin [Amedibacterium intestinale]|uniref:flavodoxin n=1 Tax=Amedibacterium intestinale TaxID=2583452 RepID=UPI00296EF56F
MKRFVYMLLTMVLTLSLVACDNSQDQTEDNGTSTSKTTETTVAKEGDSVLIAYFTAAENSGVDVTSSASYTTVNGSDVGRVRALADMIQKGTGGELFSIQTKTIYPANGEELIDYAAQEQDEDARPILTSEIKNLDQYNVVFIGYPTWWYDMPQALYSFFDTYDFSGKTIVPFNVHNGSQFSGTIETIQELEPDAKVITNGFTVSENDVADASEDVQAWLTSLGY